MYLLYVDGSGTPEPVPNFGTIPADQNTYAVVGICVHEGTWFAFEKRLNALKDRNGLVGHKPELHALAFCCSINEQDDVVNFEELDWASRRQAVELIQQKKLRGLSGEQLKERKRKFARSSAYIHLTRKERSKLFEDALDLIGTHDGIRLFGEVLDKQSLQILHPRQSAATQVFTQVLSRFDKYLTYHNSWDKMKRVDQGLLVMDQDASTEGQLMKAFDGYRADGLPWGTLNHVIESPFFVNSHNVSAIQAADLCAYALRRYILKGALVDSHEERNFKRIFHSFDRGGGRLHGLRHYCPQNTCKCMICAERGH